MQADRRLPEQEREQPERHDRDGHRDDRDLADVDAADRDQLVELRERDGRLADRAVRMSRSSATLWSRNATANVVTSITAGDCVRSGRKTARSIASESAITTAKQAAMLPAAGQSEVNASVYAPAMTSWP